MKILLLNPGFQVLFLYRLSNYFYKKGIPILPGFIQAINRFISHSDISCVAEIKSGCYIAHGIGIVIGSGVKIGYNAFILHQVTIGQKEKNTKYPLIGDNVFIGAGAKILGEITIGNNCKIGANCVVVESCPPNSIVLFPKSEIIQKNN